MTVKRIKESLALIDKNYAKKITECLTYFYFVK